MALNAAAIRALKAAGVSDSQILDAFIKADEERMARAREGNRIRQATHRARNANNAVTPVTDVTEPEQKKGPPDPLKENLPPKEKTPKGVQKKGSRLPDDWAPSTEDRDYGAKLGFSTSEIDGMAEDLRLWASAASGQVALKRDWGAAFKGWMRRDARKKPTGKPNVLPFSTPPPKPQYTETEMRERALDFDRRWKAGEFSQ